LAIIEDALVELLRFFGALEFGEDDGCLQGGIRADSAILGGLGEL
jgi:hypothetical protein